MKDQEILIPIWNSKGDILGYKDKEDVNEKTDILNLAVIMLFNRRSQLLISKLKDSLWKEKWGCSSSTIVQKDEISIESARRTLIDNLGIYKSNLILVKEKYYDLNGIRRVLSMFFMVTDEKPRINKETINETKFINALEIRDMKNNSELDPIFVAAFDNIKDLIL